MEQKKLAGYLDLANHHADATPEDIKTLCRAVLQYGFHAAFVNSCYVSLAKRELAGKAAVGTVISFPLGQDSPAIKVAAAAEAVKNGANELDVSMNVGLFKAGQKEEVLEEMKAVVAAAKDQNQATVVKFIIETGLLTSQEIQEASQLVLLSGADFVKTSSGMGKRGASLEDVRLIREAVGEKIKLKVAGGIDTLEEALSFIEAGVDRIGTSHALEIIQGLNGGDTGGGE